MNDTGRMRPSRRQEITASEAEALVATGRRIDQIIWSEFGNEQWADVVTGDCYPEYGQVLIADLLRFGPAANPNAHLARDEPWKLCWDERTARWRGWGYFLGVGTPWWSDEVTYRHVSTGWDWLGGQQDGD